MAQPKVAFEVVSIKPVPRPTAETVRDGTSRVNFSIADGRVESVGFPLLTLVGRAFDVQIQQVDMKGLGGDQTWAVEGKMPEGATAAHVPEMLRTMLEERFKLAYHREMREYPVMVLTVGKGGMKLPRLPEGTKPSSSNSGGQTTMVGTVAALFPVLNSFGGFGQTVDETGLDGMYKWVVTMQPAAGRPFQEAMRESFEEMLDAARLKFEQRKVSKETIVIDRLEKMPTEN